MNKKKPDPPLSSKGKRKPMIGTAPAGTRFYGSSARAARPRRDDDFPPRPPRFPDDLDPPDPEPVSVPDLALQVAIPLDDDQRQLMRDQLQALYPDSDVRGPRNIDGRECLAIWKEATTDSTTSAARERGLERLDVLQSGTIFTVFINGSTLKRDVEAAVRAVVDERGGPNVITSVRATLAAPDRFTLTLGGYNTDAWPDVDFTATYTDTLSLDGDRVISTAAEPDLDIDTSWQHVLLGVLSAGIGVFGVFFPPLFFIPIAYGAQEILIYSSDAPGLGSGTPGAGIAGSLPYEIAIPGGQKLHFYYTEVRLDQGGVYASGWSIEPIPREPRVRVTGEDKKTFRDTVREVNIPFGAFTQEMRGQKRYTWTGADAVVSQNGARGTLRFDLPPFAGHHKVTRTIRVRVVDEDDLEATDTFTIDIYRTTNPTPGRPPICQHKPWLPQCRPGHE